MSSFTLYTADGRRKYLTTDERTAFLKAADDASRNIRTFCHVLTYTGCRISEALYLTADRVDFAAGVITFESLKKRRRGIYRGVPVPPALFDLLNMVHGIKESKRPSGFLWEFSRMTATRRINEVMNSASIEGAHATAKGLRHGFGIAGVNAGIPLNMIQKWLGHANIQTTAIYADAVGKEEKALAARMWGELT